MPGAIIDPDSFLLLSSRTRSGIQLLSLRSKKWIPANKHAGKTVSESAERRGESMPERLGGVDLLAWLTIDLDL